MLTFPAIKFPSLSCGKRNLVRTGRNTFPDFSNDLKTLLNAKGEDFIDVCFHSGILNPLARFEQALVSSAYRLAAEPQAARANCCALGSYRPARIGGCNDEMDSSW